MQQNKKIVVEEYYSSKAIEIYNAQMEYLSISFIFIYKLGLPMPALSNKWATFESKIISEHVKGVHT